MREIDRFRFALNAHRQDPLPGYRLTPLLALPALAAELGLRALWVKDEGQRFGLNAFNVLLQVVLELAEE